MNFINLSLGELVAIFSGISALMVTLYLLDRSRRKQVVATLRFWTHAESNTELRQRRRIQQPWSLVLQLLSMALLLLAIAQIQWGSLERNAHDHVLILDTSAWTGARTARGTIMDDERLAALAWVRSLPSSDRVLLVRADGLATPATVMESRHAAVENAIRDSRPSSSALNLDQAIEFAKRAQHQGRQSGEIVYAGPGRLASDESASSPLPSNLRVLTINKPLENCGIRRIGLRRSGSGSGEWEVFLSTRNYGTVEKVAQLAVQFGGAPIGNRTLTLKPNAEQETVFPLRTKAAGLIEARLINNDAFADDNRAVLEVPEQKAMRVIAYTDEPEQLRPVLAANSRLTAQFRATAAYDPSPDADVVILDRFVPQQPPKLPSVWIEPPAQRSPVKVKTVAATAKLSRWNNDHELGQGLRTKDVDLANSEIFTPADGDVVVAESDHGPVILARPSSKLIVLGFSPTRSAMKYELATPLLFANLLRWVRPELFRRWELNGGTVGPVETEIGKHVDPSAVHVISENGKAVPYTINDGRLRFFAGLPGTVRVQTGDREIVYSLTLPEVGVAAWNVPATVRRGIPTFRVTESPVKDLWPWLAFLGAAGLFADWILFGRGRRAGRVAHVPARASQRVLQKRAS